MVVSKPNTVIMAVGYFDWSPRSEIVIDNPTRGGTVLKMSGHVSVS